jgi:hypothetical protein
VALAILSGVVALACALASARRLAWATTPVALDLRLLDEALEERPSPASVRALREAMASDPALARGWEADLFDAFLAPGDDERLRAGQLGESLIDLEGLCQRWARVPRVCASVATSTGFLAATIVLLGSLSAPAPDDTVGPAAALHEAMASAVGAFALGLAGASFCGAAHVRARRAVTLRLEEIARLVDRLESLC